MTDQISTLHTSCKDCIFAIFHNYSQVGCKMDRLEQEEVIQAYDEDSEFNIINNVKCHYKRNQSWGNKVNVENWIQRVKEENRIKYQAIIFTQDSLYDIKKTIQSLLTQAIAPQHITIVRKPQYTLAVEPILTYLNELGLPWKIHNVLDTNSTNLNIIDEIIRAVSYPYYVVFNSGFIVPENLIEIINEHIYDHHLRFAVLMNDERPVIVSTLIHKICGGNGQTSLIKKLRKEECHSLIQRIQTIYPTYPPLH